MIVARNLTKNFGRLRALDDFSVTIERGQSVLLIGPNGSGKTTFIKCVLGLVLPDKGELTLDGGNLLNSPELRAKIGYMPQIGRYPDHLKVGQIFEMLREIRRGSHTSTDEDLLDAFEIKKIAHKEARTLSGGTRQKVSACLAFLFNPDILILDEPTAGLDPVAAEILKEKVHAEMAKNKLILLTSHILSDLDEITSDVLHLMEGRIRFYRTIASLMSSHGEQRLGKVIAKIMRESALEDKSSN
jgi:Cu-processing system ATP-binding protein